jgi:large subunit ribosomal protein L29
MKYKEIKDLSVEDLENRIAEAKRDLAKLNFDHKVAPLDNPLQIRLLRKDIAKLLTALNAKLAQAN